MFAGLSHKPQKPRRDYRRGNTFFEDLGYIVAEIVRKHVHLVSERIHFAGYLQKHDQHRDSENQKNGQKNAEYNDENFESSHVSIVTLFLAITNRIIVESGYGIP